MLECSNYCTYLIIAKCRAGEMLKDMEMNPGGDRRPFFHDERMPKLSDLGITEMQSYRWQAEASVPEEEELVTNII